jgi:hypothetical protein
MIFLDRLVHHIVGEIEELAFVILVDDLDVAEGGP